jgi:methylglutaconyl-CoA hydratase
MNLESKDGKGAFRSMANELVLYRSESGIARITLNRPEKRNALNADLISGLKESLATAAQEPDVKVVLITGAGKDFCAGLDLLALDRGNSAGVLDHMTAARHLADLLLSIRKHPHPVVAAVQGKALGGGAGIAVAADLVLATDTAAIGYPEVNIGFVPAMVMAFTRRTLPEKKMFELFATGEHLPANEAVAMGLFNRVYPEAEFTAKVEAYVQNLAAKSATSLSLTKALMFHTDGMTLEKALESGVQMNAMSRTTDDAKRGFERFGKKS